MSTSLTRKSYLTPNTGDFPETVELFGKPYIRVTHLRYGTNPHQAGAYYKPLGVALPIGDMNVLKSGKGGLSQTNIEDISYSLKMCSMFSQPCFACMKHVNPSGFAVSNDSESLDKTYRKAHDGDPRAAFGCVVGSNATIDQDTAIAIMGTFVECVVSPNITEEACDVFRDFSTYKKNKHIRIIQCGALEALDKFTESTPSNTNTIKVLADGSLIIAEPLTTSLRHPRDLSSANVVKEQKVMITSSVEATFRQRQDALTAWYIAMHVRSNAVVIVKNGVALAVGTGEQDRIGAVEQAIWKYRKKYAGEEIIEGSALSSDGFFPFKDAIMLAAESGIKAVIAPSGSLRDSEVITCANENNLVYFHAPERIFSHH